MRSLPFLFREAFVNLRRHGLMTIAAITTIAVALALIGSFALTFYQIHVAMQRAVGDFEMRVFCLQSVTKKQIPDIDTRLKAIPGIASVNYVSKEQGFADLTRNQPIDTDGVPNILPEAFVVKMSDTQHAAQIASQIRGWHDVIEEVSLPLEDMHGVQQIVGFLRTVGIVGGAVLLLGTLVVVSNTIRISLFARRREMKIMQIVGASGWFIRLPLLLEGLIHGLTGGALAAGILAAVARWVNGLVQQSMSGMARYFQPVDMLLFGCGVVLLGTLIGAVGSLLSVRRYLRVL